MNEATKLTIATSLVALGLGLAYLCGPPSGAPQVVREPVSPTALDSQSVSAIAAVAPLRLHADAPPSAEILAGGSQYKAGLIGGSDPNGVVLSAAETDSSNEAPKPHWLAPTSAIDDQNALPPRRVDADDQAAPLPATPQPSDSVNTNDDWLLKPPTMPHSFDSKPASGESSSSLASESTSRAGNAAGDAWWTQDTQRLQGLSGSSQVEARKAATPRDALTQSSTKLVQPANSNTQLTVPIDLDATPASPVVQPINSAAIGSPPPFVRNIAPPPIVAARTHLIADGDTLNRLAERYLQDPARAREIFELNQDVLRDPNLLPIGKPLRIPGKTNPSESGPELDDSTGRMVPVEAAPRTAVIQPQAQLQTPAPIALNGW